MLRKRLLALTTIMILTIAMGPLGILRRTASGEPLKQSSQPISDIISYDQYLDQYPDVNRAVPSTEIEALSYTSTTAQVAEKSNLGTKDQSGLYIGDEGLVEWQVEIAKTGLYQIGLLYFPTEGKGSNIEKILYIDGKIPFQDANSLSVSRIWKNETENIEQDNRGNDKYPRQIEVFRWCEEYYRDSMGFYDEPLLFYLEKGQHTIGLEAVKEPIIIGKIILKGQDEIPTYAEALEQYKSQGLEEIILSEPLKIQAETADYKSSPVLSPVYDRSSPLVEPYGGSKLRLNILGGGRFSGPNMWIEYVIKDIPEDGLYQIVFKSKQNGARGLKVTRRLYVNGELPYEEAGNIGFEYTSGYINKVLGDEKPCLIPLKKGENILKIESSLGVLADFCREVTESLLTLNEAYRRLVVITGTNPDLYRDYMVEKKLPEVIETFRIESQKLRDTANHLEQISGENSSHTAILKTIALQLEKMYKKPSRVPREVGHLNSNLSSLGTWVNDIKQTNLDMDYLLVSSDGLEHPIPEANLLNKMVHEVKMFFASFFEDYNSIGDTSESDRTITVWINSGRDQAAILKQLIDSDFTPKNNIQVDMKLVQGALLQATVAGRAPDAALTMGQGDPVNYAIRNAVYDLTNFEDFDEVAERFSESAMVPLQLNGSYYGLPERATFPMLFYRKDILQELGVEVPQTWDDVYKLLPILQRNNMNFGLPVSDVSSGSNAGILSFGSILYQMGGTFYSEDGSCALFDSEEGIKTMKQWSALYTSYGLPLSFDFVNRFSTGEMPLAVVDYTSYNQLTVFAPQIRNMWGITSIPGTLQADGSISHKTPISITGCMIMQEAAPEKKIDSWEFLKWWTSTEIQTQFARELECLMGEAGRYPTANLEAMMNIAWPTQDLKHLQRQFDDVFGIQEVPGGYYTWRHLDNAFREIINNNVDAREVMVDYNLIINKEIDIKRKEFGLK